MSIDLFIVGTKTKVMAARSKKGDVLFAVSALPNSLFDSENICAYMQLIEDYFADSKTEVGTGN